MTTLVFGKGARLAGILRCLPVVLLLAVAVVSGLPYLSPGQPTSPDIWSHLARQKIVFESLRDGYSPFYTFMFYSGYPHLRFYSPLCAFLAGFLTLLWHGNLFPPLKFLLFSLHVLSAITMFAFLRRRTGSAWASALGAAAYVLIPWRTLHIATLANLPQSLIYVLMPLMFLSADEVLNHSDFRHALLLGLWTALALVSHLFSAAYAVLLVAVWAAFQLGMRENSLTVPFPRTSRLLLLAVAVLVSVLLSAWNTLPFAIEYQSHVYPLPDINLPLPSLSALLLPWVKPGGYTGGYLGLSIVFLALVSIAVLLARWHARRTGLALSAMMVVILLLTFAVPAWRPTRLLFTAGLPGVRFMVFFVFVVALLVGSGWSLLERRLAVRRPLLYSLLSLGLLVSFCLDCLPHVLENRNSTDLGFLSVRDQAYQFIKEERPTRVLDLYNHADRIDDFRRLACFPAMGFIYGDLPTAQGPAYYQFAPRSMSYVYPWSNFVAADLGAASDSLSENSLKALLLLGVSHLITPPSKVSDSVVFLKTGLDWEDRFLRARLSPPLAYGRTHSGLLLCSRTVLPLPEESLVRQRTLLVADDWLTLLSSAEIDRSSRQLNFIPVASGEPAHAGTDPALLGESTETSNCRVSSVFETDDDCFLRVALSYYPWLSVRLDGRPVEFRETRDHFMWLACPAGRHRLEVTAPLSPLRIALLWVSGFALIAGIALAAVPGRRIARRANP